MPGHEREAPAIEFDDAGRQPLQERAVVGDEEHRAGVIGQQRLEPGDGLDVEMIGRLVEQQQVGLGHQRARQQRAAAPPARQRVDGRIGRQAQTRQHGLDALLHIPAVLLVQLVLCLRQAFQRPGRVIVRDLDGRMVIRRHQRADVAETFGDDVEDRCARGERHVLLEARDAHAGLQPPRAGVGRLLAAGDAEQRRLAGAVAADQADAFAAVDLHRRAVDQGQVSEGD